MFMEILKRMVIVRKGTTWYYLDTEHPFFESQEDIDKVVAVFYTMITHVKSLNLYLEKGSDENCY